MTNIATGESQNYASQNAIDSKAFENLEAGCTALPLTPQWGLLIFHHQTIQVGQVAVAA